MHVSGKRQTRLWQELALQLGTVLPLSVIQTASKQVCHQLEFRMKTQHHKLTLPSRKRESAEDCAFSKAGLSPSKSVPCSAVVYLGRTPKPHSQTAGRSERKDDIALDECCTLPDTVSALRPQLKRIPLGAFIKLRRNPLLQPVSEQRVSITLPQLLSVITFTLLWVSKSNNKLTRHTTDLSNQACSEGICEGREMIHRLKYRQSNSECVTGNKFHTVSEVKKGKQAIRVRSKNSSDLAVLHSCKLLWLSKPMQITPLQKLASDQ